MFVFFFFVCLYIEQLNLMLSLPMSCGIYYNRMVRVSCGPGQTPCAATIALWSGGGCPNPYATGGGYESKDVVLHGGLVFQYREAPNHQWCGMTGYELGTGQAWDMACTLLGAAQAS